MQRAATVVDIAAIRLVVNGDHFGAEGTEQSRSEQTGGAISAIEHQFQSIEIRFGDYAPAEIRPIFFIECLIGLNRDSMRVRITAFVLVNLGCKMFLDIIRKLHPRSGE